MGDLFFNSWSTASLYYVVNHPLFIAGIILLILLVLLIVFVCCYSTYWKKKKEIELLVRNYWIRLRELTSYTICAKPDTAQFFTSC